MKNFNASIIYLCRCDQYRWVHKVVYNVKSDECHGLMKRSNFVDDKYGDGRRRGNCKFRRWESWGHKSYFLLHYTGDHSIFIPFAHRSASGTKSNKPFIRSAPHIVKKVFYHLVYSVNLISDFYVFLLGEVEQYSETAKSNL